jgi:hypothetical protein
MVRVAGLLRAIYASLSLDSLKSKLFDLYGWTIEFEPAIENKEFIAKSVLNILKDLPIKLIKSCGVKRLQLKNLGLNREYYPNHGFYIGDLIALNSNIFLDPDMPEDFENSRGYRVSRPTQTLIHEIGHALDFRLGDISLKPEWLSLSGWSKEYKSGLKRLLIKEKGTPDVVGEWFYDPKAEFFRFYGKKCPEDDFADSLGIYYSLINDKIPTSKRKFLENLLKVYN